MRRRREARPAARQSGFSAFRHRDFKLFWSGAVFSNVGTWMQLVTVPYVVDQLTGSTAWVGLAAFCTYFPTTIVAPWAGSIADRLSRRAVLIWSQAVSLVVALALWALWTSGRAEPVSVVALVFVGAIANGFTMTAWQAFVPQLVPTEDLISAVRLNSVSYTGARAIGPAIAGLVLATFGAGAAFLANAASFAVVIAVLLLIANRSVTQSSTDSGVLTHFREGWRYLRAREAIVVATLAGCMTAFFGLGATQLAEPMARHMFHTGAGAYGVMVGAYGVGAIVGTLFTITRGDGIPRSTMTIAGITVFVVGLIVLGTLSSFAGALAVFGALGVAHVFTNLSSQTAVQVNVEESYRARVMSIFMIGFFIGTPIGALVAGVAAQVVGLRETVIAFGVLFGICAVVLGWRCARYRPLNDSRPLVPDPAVGDPAVSAPPTTAPRTTPSTAAWTAPGTPDGAASPARRA
jgi:MFS family permease